MRDDCASLRAGLAVVARLTQSEARGLKPFWRLGVSIFPLPRVGVRADTYGIGWHLGKASIARRAAATPGVESESRHGEPAVTGRPT